METDGFGCCQPADGDLSARHGGRIADQFGAVFHDTGKDQAGYAVRLIVGPE